MQFANDITPLTLASSAKLRELEIAFSKPTTTGVIVSAAARLELESREYETDRFRFPQYYTDESPILEDSVESVVNGILGV